MPFKTITIKNEVYHQLIKAKPKKESFSAFFTKILSERRPDLMKFLGAWEAPEKEHKQFEQSRKKIRQEFTEGFKPHESPR